MTYLAEDSFFDTFWAGAAAVVALLGIPVGAWATLRASNPKRRLEYGLATHSLLGVSPRGSLQVQYDGQQILTPHLVTVHIVNRGRRDISSAVFDQGNPLKAETGRQILELLAVRRSEGAGTSPPATIDNTGLLIGPGRIGSSDSFTYELLVDGHPELSFEHELIDVQVREERDQSARLRHTQRVVLLAAWATTAMTVASLVSLIYDAVSR